MADHISELWMDLQTQNRLPKGILTSSCEAELQELMKQIDIMMATKKKDWEYQLQSLNAKVEVKDKENMLQKSTIEQKHKEIGHLRQQVQNMEKSHKELVTCYEAQLSNLKVEVQKVKKDYERLAKKHVKQTKESQKERDKSVTDLQESNTEINRLNGKLVEYRQRAKDWELQRRTLTKQLEALEAQRKALTEKCEFIQSQSQTYQSQLDRRKQMLDSTELSFKTQIAQLESQIEHSNETLQIQETKVDKLKASLDEAMNAHKKAMDDNERLLMELKRANDSVRKLEEDKGDMETELRAKEDLIRAVEEDSGINSESVSKLEVALAEKDNIIKSLSDIRDKEESDQLQLMKESIAEAQEESRISKRNEKVLKEEMASLQSHLQNAVQECERLTDQLQEKEMDLQKIENGEVKKLKSEVNKLKEQNFSLKEAHEAQVEGMRLEISHLTKDLHDRNVAMATLSEQSTYMEKQLRNESDTIERRSAELQVSNAQIEALRLENRHLRQTILQHVEKSTDNGQTKEHIKAVQNAYTTTVAKLEQQNRQLRDDLACIREEMNEMEEKFEEQLQLALKDSEMSVQDIRAKEDRRIRKIEQDTDRKIRSMQERLNSTVQRYEEEVRYLRSQNTHLEQQLGVDRDGNFGGTQMNDVSNHDVMTSYHGNNNSVLPNGFNPELTNGDADNSFDTVLSSQAMSISDSMQDFRDQEFEDVNVGNSVTEKFLHAENLHNSVAEKFLQAENQRAKELEKLIDSHIQNLKLGTEATLKKYSSHR